MAKFVLTMEIDAPDEYGLTAQSIRDAVYEAGEELPFSFDITDIKEG